MCCAACFDQLEKVIDNNHDSEEDNEMEDEVFLDNGKPSHCHLFVPLK